MNRTEECACGKRKSPHDPVCGACWNRALAILRATPAYKAYVLNHSLRLASLVDDARSYMGTNWRYT